MILILLFLITSFCPAEQLIRDTWTLNSGNSLLYRVSDESALAEISLFSNQEDTWNPGVLLMETASFQIGSLQPSGIWKFTSMSAPVRQSVLRQRNGFVPNRTENSLQSPGAAYYTRGGGGGMIQSREEMLQYSLWQSFDINMYSPVTLGFSQTYYSPSLPEDNEWFSTALIPGNHFYFTAADFKTELAWSRFQLMAANSLSEYMEPGFSILPVYTIYWGSHDISLRYWLNTEHWVNRNIERPDWHQYGDSTAHIRINDQMLFTTEIFGAEGEGRRKQGCSLSLNHDTGFSVITVKYELDSSCNDERNVISNAIEASVRRKTIHWICSAEGRIQYEGSRITAWQSAGSVSRIHKGGLFSTLSLSGKSEPGELEIKSVLEETVPLGNMKCRAAGGYIIHYGDPVALPEDSLILKIQLEWSPG